MCDGFRGGLQSMSKSTERAPLARAPPFTRSHPSRGCHRQRGLSGEGRSVPGDGIAVGDCRHSTQQWPSAAQRPRAVLCRCSGTRERTGAALVWSYATTCACATRSNCGAVYGRSDTCSLLFWCLWLSSRFLPRGNLTRERAGNDDVSRVRVASPGAHSVGSAPLDCADRATI